MIFKASVTNLAKAVNKWNGDYSLGLRDLGATGDKATWGVGVCVITAEQLPPMRGEPLARFEVDRAHATWAELLRMLKAHFDELPLQDYPPGETERIARKSLASMATATRYFELSIGDRAIPKSVAKWLAGEIDTLPPLPVTFGDKQAEITAWELTRPDPDGLGFYYLRAKAHAWRVVPDNPSDDLQTWLQMPGSGQDLGNAVTFELRETGPGRVHLLGECQNWAAGYVALLMGRIKETWPQTREMTPAGVEREQALTWAETAQPPASAASDAPTPFFVTNANSAQLYLAGAANAWDYVQKGGRVGELIEKVDQLLVKSSTPSAAPDAPALPASGKMIEELSQRFVFNADAQSVCEYIAGLKPHPKRDHGRPAITVADENFTCACEFLIGARRDALYTFELSVSVWWGKPDDDIANIWEKMLLCDYEPFGEITLRQEKAGECEARLYLADNPRYANGKPLSPATLGISTRLIVDVWRGLISGWLARPTLPTSGASDGLGESSKALDDIKNGVVEILREMQQQRIEQGEIQNLLEAIRRVLGYVLKAGLPADAETKKRWDEIYQAINSDMSFRQKLELSLPIIPFLLEYKAEVGAGVDIRAAWQEFQERLQRDK